jgi:hypothetical protein
MKSLRTFVITSFVLLATAAPSFALLGGSDPRPPTSQTASSATVVAQTLLALSGL